MVAEKKNIVIIGAGIGGGTLASKLSSFNSKDFLVTVIERRDASFIKYGGARSAALGPSFSHRVLVPNSKVVDSKNGKVIHATVKGINTAEKKVETDNAEFPSVSYDFLVLATGTQNNSATEVPEDITTFKAAQEHYKFVSEKIKEAKSILLIGGGPVACELAGEILETYKDKKVTIVERGKTLLSAINPELPAKTVTKLKTKLEKMGAKVLPGQVVENLDLSEFGDNNLFNPESGRKFTTSKGDEIEADLVMKCIGVRFRTGFLPEDWLTEKKQVKVNDYLQVLGADGAVDGVFALGDINDVKEAKQGYLAGVQAGKLAKTLKAAAAGKGSSGWTKYKAGPATGMVVPLGTKVGQGYMMMHMGNFLVSSIKGKDLFLPATWSTFNMKKDMVDAKDPKWEEKTKDCSLSL
eukprot:snap_masked-scaffold_4-processed-gene-11.34-mRNA-1 protein AED:1.00 eAED:1.00 QI:0/0/0/0/1/1/2/0/409